MDEETGKAIRCLAKQLINLNQGMLELRASVNVLKVTVIGLSGDDPKVGLAELQKAEEKILAIDPSVQASKEISDVIELWEKYPPKQNSDS